MLQYFSFLSLPVIFILFFVMIFFAIRKKLKENDNLEDK